MLVGVGVDIVHLPRIASLIARRRNNCQLLCRRILSPTEQNEFQTRFVSQPAPTDEVPNPDVVQFLASRWSIKEALYKAVYPEHKLTWKDVTIEREGGAKPKVVLAGQDLNMKAHISVSHDGEYAIAYAVVER
ncbi:hypothetical protein INT43_006086, partial [Umbelopsis isabellina]